MTKWEKDKRNKNRRKEDNPISPTYYKGRDVMDIINRYSLSFCLGNVVKYVLRSKEKNEKEDLEKAMWYLKEEISKMEIN
jgi:CRISPR/Cas system-associated protein Cas5 (RAMP superfamily)